MKAESNLTEFIINFQRKTKQKCDICSSVYKFGNSEHVCKRCNRSVCQQCGSHKVKCYLPNYKNQPHRMCTRCYTQSQYLQKYVKSNNLKWGQDSDLVKLWLRKLGLKSLPKKSLNQKVKINEHFGFQQIWKSLNYSFREFIGVVIDETKISQKQFLELVNIALSQLTSKKTIVKTANLVYIVLFFLAHCDVHHTIYFTSVILQTISLQELSLDNVHFFLQQYNCSEMEIYKMESIIEEVFQKIIRNCSVNVFTAEMSIELVNLVLTKKQFEVLERGVAYVFHQRKEFICQNANKPQEVLLDILRNLSTQNFRKAFKDLEGDPSYASPDRYSESSKSSKQSQKSSSSQLSKQQLVRELKRVREQNQKLSAIKISQESELEKLRAENKRFHAQAEVRKQKERKLLEENYSKNNRQIQLSKSKAAQIYDVSTSSETDQAIYSNVLSQKNQQILRLKRQIDALKEALNNAKSQNTNEQKEGMIQVQKKAYRELVEQNQKLKQQGQGLKNTNKVLFHKLSDLSKLLMDKQQKTLNEANKFLDQIPGTNSDQKLDQNLKQCSIF